jgi:hypothetical protein
LYLEDTYLCGLRFPVLYSEKNTIFWQFCWL